MTLSVICPIYNEEQYIEACIESILAQDFPREDFEVIFADGMSSDRTREIVVDYAVRYPFIRLIDNPRRIVPPALNAAITASKGDIIMRLDAHAAYPANYFSALVEAHNRYMADNIGAPCRTDVLHKTRKSLARFLRILSVWVIRHSAQVFPRPKRSIPFPSVVGVVKFSTDTASSTSALSEIKTLK